MKSGVLRQGAYLEYPPGVYKDPTTGEAKGFDIDLGKAMADALGVKQQVVESTWDGLIPGLQSGKFDIIMSQMTPRPSRGLSVTFAKDYHIEKVGLVVGQERDCGTIDDWNKPTVTMAVQTGTYSDFAQKQSFPNAQVVTLASGVDAFLQIATRKVDAMPASNILAGAYISAHPESKMKICFDQGDGLTGVITAAPAVPFGDLVFANWIDLFISDQINSGQYSKMYKADMGIDQDIALLRELRGSD
jgi:polar amino acid transport system substrate-binding protein